jgi:DNA repair protein RecN (Recombination protein N)
MLAVEVVFAGSDPVPSWSSTRSTPASAGEPPSRSADGWPGLARSHQVVVVTHLPQVAAFADAHLLVVKAAEGTAAGAVHAQRRPWR